MVPLFGIDVVYLRDADAIVEVATNPHRYPKDTKLYSHLCLFVTNDSEVLDIYGRNVVTLEGPEWRLHRKITSRPFSEKNNQLVHSETVRQANEMMASWEKKAVNGTVVVEKYFHDPLC